MTDELSPDPKHRTSYQNLSCGTNHKVRDWGYGITQSCYEYAREHWQDREYAWVLGIQHIPARALSLTDPKYLCVYLADDAADDYTGEPPGVTAEVEFKTAMKWLFIHSDPTARLLIHCTAGQNRSTFFTAMALSVRAGIHPNKALEFVSRVMAAEEPQASWGPGPRWRELADMLWSNT